MKNNFSNLHISIFLTGVITGGVIFLLFNKVTRFTHPLSKEDQIYVKTHIENTIKPDKINKPRQYQELDLDKFWKVLSLLERDYIAPPSELEGKDLKDPLKLKLFEKRKEENILDREKFINSAIQGLTRATGDRYTTYFYSKTAKDFKDEVIKGEIDGIGAYLSYKSNILKVESLIQNGPAKGAGLKPRDVILEIDGISVELLSFQEAIHMIRGKRKTEVELKIIRVGEIDPLVIPIIRNKIEIPSIETEFKDGVFIIKLKSFNKQTSGIFRETLKEFQTKNTDKLILDLRDNTGGLLSATVEIASYFLEGKKTVLYRYEGDEKLTDYSIKRNKKIVDNLPKILILVNGATASGSEILAAALEYHKIGTTIGTKTFGKGSVQSIKNLDSDSFIKITTAHWLTPDKKSITDKGLTPTIDLTGKLKEEFKNNLDLDIETFLLEETIKEIKK